MKRAFRRDLLMIGPFGAGGSFVFLRSRSEHAAVLQAHYVNMPTNHATALPIHQKLQPLLYFGSQLADHSLIAN
jgi:hypothetical protein